MNRPEQPRLLAQRSQYGYININPSNPDISRAMHHEPEPITPHQLENLQHQANIQRAQHYAATKGSALNILQQIQPATGHERRKLENAQRAIKSL